MNFKNHVTNSIRATKEMRSRGVNIRGKGELQRDEWQHKDTVYWGYWWYCAQNIKFSEASEKPEELSAVWESAKWKLMPQAQVVFLSRYLPNFQDREGESSPEGVPRIDTILSVENTGCLYPKNGSLNRN